MLNSIKTVAVIILCLSLSGSTIWVAHRVDVLSRKGEEIARHVSETTDSIADAAQVYSEQVRSPQNLKSIEHGMELGKVATETVVKFNRSTIPILNAALTDLRGNEASLNRLTLSLDSFVAKDLSGLITSLTDQVAGHLIPEMTQLLAKLGLTTDDLRTSIKIAFDQAILSLEDIHKLAADPKWQQILTSVAQGVEHVNGTSAQVELASKSLPAIAESLAKIAKSGATFNKLIAVARILSLIVPIL